MTPAPACPLLCLKLFPILRPCCRRVVLLIAGWMAVGTHTYMYYNSKHLIERHLEESSGGGGPLLIFWKTTHVRKGGQFSLRLEQLLESGRMLHLCTGWRSEILQRIGNPSNHIPTKAGLGLVHSALPHCHTKIGNSMHAIPQHATPAIDPTATPLLHCHSHGRSFLPSPFPNSSLNLPCFVSSLALIRLHRVSWSPFPLARSLPHPRLRLLLFSLALAQKVRF
jgi:hypothetical protein